MKKRTRRILKYSICFIAGFVLRFALGFLFQKADIWSALGTALGITIGTVIGDLILVSKKNKRKNRN